LKLKPEIRITEMKLFCPLSGVSYHTNIGYGHGQAPHPIFYLPLKSLIVQHLDNYCEGKLSEEEIHLFGCAMLHKLPVIWEHPVSITENTKYNWKKYLEKLATICLKHGGSNPNDLPQYHIDKRNNDLSNLGIYLSSIDDAIAELAWEADPETGEVPQPNYITRNAEETILRMLRGSMSRAEKRETFPKLMADWAANVGKFPATTVTAEITYKGTRTVTLREHWHEIVYKLFAVPDVVSLLSTEITPGDLDEVIEHCETTVEIGTIHSLALFKKLREAKAVLEEFRSPAPSASMIVAKAAPLTAAFLSGEDNVSKVTQDRPKVSVPESEPLRKDYPNSAAYIRAKIAWQRGI
jgi:hypothetical protein